MHIQFSFQSEVIDVYCNTSEEFKETKRFIICYIYRQKSEQLSLFKPNYIFNFLKKSSLYPKFIVSNKFHSLRKKFYLLKNTSNEKIFSFWLNFHKF